jgi:DNA repair protein RadC
MSRVNSKDPAPYSVKPSQSTQDDDLLISLAIATLESRFKKTGIVFDSPHGVKEYCRLNFGRLEHEEFGILFLNSQNQLIQFESMFRGTLSQASVYPREIVKRALALNAGAVILTHNHPSGICEPSRADEFLTSTLKSALALVDVRILDHLVVSAISAVSMAERGLI